MTDYEPGTVAVATVRGVPNVRVVRYDTGHEAGWWTNDTDRYHSDDELTDVRPLIVLDLEDLPDLKSYLPESQLDYDSDDHRLVSVINQIEAQTKPPKPAEPTGLGAVVEDAEGKRWVLAEPADATPWVLSSDADEWEAWDCLDAVRVLSKGVQP